MFLREILGVGAELYASMYVSEGTPTPLTKNSILPIPPAGSEKFVILTVLLAAIGASAAAVSARTLAPPVSMLVVEICPILEFVLILAIKGSEFKS